MTLRKIKYKLLHIYYMVFKGKPVGVAMFHFGRCGSTVLSQLLGQNSSIKWDNELFEILKNDKNKPYDVQFENNYLTILKNRFNRTTQKIYGFETKSIESAHLSESFINTSLKEYIDYLVKLGFKHFIILKRENYLKQLVSVARGIEMKKWHFENNETIPSRALQFDPKKVLYGNKEDKLIGHFENFDMQYKLIHDELDAKKVKVLSLIYEQDIENDPVTAYYKVCEFMNITKEKVSFTLKKSQTLPLKEEIQNFGDVALCLTGTKYEWMLKQ